MPQEAGDYRQPNAIVAEVGCFAPPEKVRVDVFRDFRVISMGHRCILVKESLDAIMREHPNISLDGVVKEIGAR